MIRRSRTGTQLVKVGVTAAIAGEGVDPTEYPVEVALMVEGERPSDSDYKSASWETIGGKYYACVLAGPEGLIQWTDTDEAYLPWVRIDPPGSERPEVKGGPDHIVEVY
jgi:hypothetical protein